MKYNSTIKTIEWLDDENCSRMINQQIISEKFEFYDVKNSKAMYYAIKDMIVRGAPAIGIAGAHGVLLAATEIFEITDNRDIFMSKLQESADYLTSSRPTAVNLMWAIDKQMECAKSTQGSIKDIIFALKNNAVRMENEDIEINKKIGENGAKLVPKKGATILTHCNAGALATVGYGTALGVIRSIYKNDSTIKVFADETRPRQQGARLTTYELTSDGIDTTLITDGMCSYFMSKGMIDMVVVGADRIAANGDAANKIGTYTVAICAKYHNVPFYVAAPVSTIDAKIKTGKDIKIEERNKEEVTVINGKPICADNVNVINPGFDVTPNELITGIITEKGVFLNNGNGYDFTNLVN